MVSDSAIAHYDPILLEALNESIESSPNNARAYQARGLIWIHAEDYGAAIADFSEVIRIEPENAQAYTYRGTSRFWLRQYAGALADFDRALELETNPEPVVYFNRGYVHRVQGNVAAAMADFRRGAELAQAQDDTETYAQARSLIDDLEPLPILGTDDVLGRGQEKIFAGDFLGAVSDFAEVLRRPGANTQQQVMAYRQQSQAWVALGNLDAALENLTAALELDAEDALTWLELGQVHLDQAEFDGALSTFNRALELNPDLTDVYYQRGITYIELEQYPSAIADFTAALERDNTLASAYGARGLAYYEQGELELAIADLEQAAELYRNQGNFAGYQQTLVLLETVKATILQER
ncbi:MAG: tetratricopeptide repeat protein [Spirulina sp. SIO3F2]|nr:tetratricopeptide repeat protein [Spirulina sp. SIO3F2]